MVHDHSHAKMMESVFSHVRKMFAQSDQAMYVYLDDLNKICNQKFATLLGYQSPEEWANLQEPFTSAFVDPKSQETLVTAYQNAMEKLMGSCIDIEWKKRSGKPVKTQVILVPFVFEDHLLALHFISEKK